MDKLELTKALIIKRPSLSCKTPYVADAYVYEEDGSCMVHTPALGCCGLSDKDAVVYMSKVQNKKNVCNYRVELSSIYEPKIQRNIFVGINPKLAEELVNHALINNSFSFLSDLKSFKREKKIEGTNSRFDFVGVDKNDKPFVLEVKNVPLADYVDCDAKERKKMDPHKFDHIDYNEKIAYFPDGYRKTKKEPVSPRAIKHLYDLKSITTNYRTIMCYVIQREDVKYFQPSVIDPFYREAFYDAYENGVEMHAVQFVWDENGNFILKNDNIKIL